METIAQREARITGTVSGNSPLLGVYPEGEKQSFKRGQFVKLSSGKIVECEDGSMSIFGMAAHDASGLLDADVQVYLACDDTIFEANVYHEVKDQAVTSEHLVNMKFGIKSTDWKNFVNISDPNHPVFKVHQLSPKDEVGDLNGRVRVTVVRE